MPSTAAAVSPASRIALRIASTAMARVVRPDAREYSVSPTPTMQYLSRSPRLWTTIAGVPPLWKAHLGRRGPSPATACSARGAIFDGREMLPLCRRPCHWMRGAPRAVAERTRITGGALCVAVRLFVQAGVQIGHDLDRAAEVGAELRQLCPGAVDLGAEPLVFLLERLRFVLEPLVILPHRSRFRLQAFVLLERAANGVHAVLHGLDPSSRFAGRVRGRDSRLRGLGGRRGRGEWLRGRGVRRRYGGVRRHGRSGW